MKMTRYGLTIAVGLVGAAMFLNVALWIFAPLRAAEALRMPLLSGDALSSQMDIAAFFLGNAVFVLLALITRQKEWFIAPCILFFGAAGFRLLAWALHGATLTVDMIAFELIMGAILLISSRVLTVPSD